MSLIVSIGPLRKSDPTPLYLQLQKGLRRAIEKRVVQPDAAIPNERDLAELFGISRITVRKAVDALVEEGLLARRQGAGTFVTAPRVEKQFSRLTSFSEDMIARGRRPHSVWVSRSKGPVTPEEALSLGLSPGSQVYRFHRIRYGDDLPMAIEYATIPGYSLASEDAVGASLYEALAASGHMPARVLQRLRAVNFTAEQAAMLGVAPGDAGLFFERRGFLADGRAAEHTLSYYRGDAYELVAELDSR
ncbi:GntR family transcriptional regulator [Sphingomonas sp. LB-2]|uniref:GntR family transcriptional regulator n=1 Tax=Sphingomonas caeni TaxID=2984949 RepID=UPI0022312013|nr:GntR family transcriptional regulator [Sphingomonas caeni]MCW3848030.1 GntR family transcriptional regulator [Sphingomonas caeni]